MTTSLMEAAPPDPEFSTDAAAPTSTDENLYLIGRPPLKGYMRFVSSHAVEPPPDEVLSRRWHAARDVVARLEQDEAGIANDPPIAKLGPEYRQLLTAFVRDPLVKNGFNTVPTQVAMIDLDRLVVYQERVDITFARELERRLGPAPADDLVFRTCLPFDHPLPPAKWARMHGDKFVFLSPSNDLRYLESMRLEPRDVTGYAASGSLVGVVGVGVGFGSNFMNAIYAENRLILNNGSHRAYVLRRMGIRHVPCIIQHCANREELSLVACSQVRRDLPLYLNHARPPMLRDYLDPRLHDVITVRRRMRQVTVSFHVDEDFIPAM
ncbi:MAG: hypothetical protein ACHQSE_12455 [Gemmatimonadales bacterium]